MTQSLALISQKQYDKAIEELEKVAKNTKNEAVRNEAKYLLAESHSQLGNYEQAAEIYADLIKKGNSEKSAEIAIKLQIAK
jgi:TolA-binding protein